MPKKDKVTKEPTRRKNESASSYMDRVKKAGLSIGSKP
jgi:hypothetical protein